MITIEKVTSIPVAHNGGHKGEYKYRPHLENWARLKSGSKFKVITTSQPKAMYAILRSECKKWKIHNLTFHQRSGKLYGQVL